MKNQGLTDTFHRRINYLRVSVTDRCNLRCTYCMPAGGVDLMPHGEILSYEEILRVVRLAAGMGITKVRVTGGEPLVRRGLADFLRRVSDLEAVTDLSLTTNGTLLAPMAQKLKDAGLNRVNVSLDTLNPATFAAITRYEGLEKVLAGIDAARAVGLTPIKVNVVALRGVNDGEILDFARFADEKGLEVRYIEHMPSGGDGADGREYLTGKEILDTLAAHTTLTPLAAIDSAAGPGRTFVLPGGGRIGIISPLSNHFCGTCNRLRLTSDGRLRSCLFSNDDVPVRELLRSGADDDAVRDLIRRTVSSKPEGHMGGGTLDGMSRIGG